MDDDNQEIEDRMDRLASRMSVKHGVCKAWCKDCNFVAVMTTVVGCLDILEHDHRPAMQGPDDRGKHS